MIYHASNYPLFTSKDAPKDFDTKSARYLYRAGFIRKVAKGIYTFMPLGMRVLNRIIKIIKEEMDRIGFEVSLPVVQPDFLWKKSGRWNKYGDELVRFRDRANSWYCIAPTAEELITWIFSNELSYKDLPKLFYQIGIKFRDELRPRFGIQRSREFLMKDAYSFHATKEELDDFYEKVLDTYRKIFDRIGVEYEVIHASTGTIGGSISHEFVVKKLSENFSGEVEYVGCSCGYRANIEVAEFKPVEENENMLPKAEVYTPGLKTVEDVSKFLNEPPEKFLKSMLYEINGEDVLLLVRGNREINENFLTKFGSFKLKTDFGDVPVGFLGPAGSKYRIIADNEIKYGRNFITGANKNDYHVKNINPGRDFEAEYMSLSYVKEGDLCKCGRKLEFNKAVEVGHIFKLMDLYSKSIEAYFLDAKGNRRPFYMGCYGIGVSRILSAVIEQVYDLKKMFWPRRIAPFDAVIIEIKKRLKYNFDTKLDIIIDDRPIRPGVKFNDWDLIGVPVKVISGEKEKIEVRVLNDVFYISENEFEGFLRKLEAGSLVY